ncbi:hypothetical protein ABH973_003634 [Bradyrhizobium ottawaense]
MRLAMLLLLAQRKRVNLAAAASRRATNWPFAPPPRVSRTCRLSLSGYVGPHSLAG